MVANEEKRKDPKVLTLEDIYGLDIIKLEQILHVGRFKEGRSHRKIKSDCPICKHDLRGHVPICRDKWCLCLRSEALKCQLMIVERENVIPLYIRDRDGLIRHFLDALIVKYGADFWKVPKGLRHADTQTYIHAKTATESE